jgi:4-hydroxybenzoate polyprenyltransferase
MEDLRGDNTFGCKTLPIVLGIRKTKVILYTIITLFSISVIVLDQTIEALPFKYYLIFLFLPLIVLTGRLVRADMKRDFSWLSTFCKVILLLGILSMAFV